MSSDAATAPVALDADPALRPDAVATSRTVVKLVEAREQAEGAGARVRRSIGGSATRNFDPFLMLDEFHVSKPAGFPDHPHRGFETVTYMLKGSFVHEDFCGHKGTIGPGDLQWMTAGRGILHAEMPSSAGDNVGLQLWVNLAAKDKMAPPAYQELLSKDIPKLTLNGVHATIIAGTAFGVTSPVYTRTPTSYLDFKMGPDTELTQLIPSGWNSFVYTLSGAAVFGPPGKTVSSVAHHTLLLSNEAEEDGVRVRAGPEGCHFVLLAGKPIGEPVVQHGPFVMNTRDEIMQAMRDYQSGTNGFEKAAAFVSSISGGV